MGWSYGYDQNWKRDVGYGVPAKCDHPGCNADIDRGLSHVCKNEHPFGQSPEGDDDGCGLYFCEAHLSSGACERCVLGAEPFEPTKDVPEWVDFKLSDDSWAEWRRSHPNEVVAMMANAGQRSKPVADPGEEVILGQPVENELPSTPPEDLAGEESPAPSEDPVVEDPQTPPEDDPVITAPADPEEEPTTDVPTPPEEEDDENPPQPA